MKPQPFIATLLFGLLFELTAQAQWLPPAPTDQPVTTIQLKDLLAQGHEIHHTLQSEPVNELLPGMSLKTNPQWSTDQAFIEVIARRGSQGRLTGVGMQEALFAQYSDGDSEFGLYGLAAENESVAVQREQALREIWAHNHSLDRTHIHRQGVMLLVVWVRTGETLPAVWDAVKAWAARRLSPGLES